MRRFIAHNKIGVDRVKALRLIVEKGDSILDRFMNGRLIAVCAVRNGPEIPLEGIIDSEAFVKEVEGRFKATRDLIELRRVQTFVVHAVGMKNGKEASTLRQKGVLVNSGVNVQQSV